MPSKRLGAETKAKIIAAYVRGDKTDAIAARYNCDPSYPGIIAARAGHPHRTNQHSRNRMSEAARTRKR